ncbi:MAG: ORF6N domain-containing protein [Candidatus Omnitrophica bacterium]|nr:ORF6N domain-containing protein [Candidatus Omnitrophota bacterium]
MRQDLIPSERIEEKIFLIRGHKVMIDRDLAELYGVETKYLNRQVKRNKERFPDEFTFQLAPQEKEELVTICHRFETMKHSSSLPSAFTEHGVAMLASVLKSPIAVKMSILVVKAFIRLREVVATHKELICKLQDLERKVGHHDGEIKVLFEAIRHLTAEPEKSKGRIGFHPPGQ